MEHPTPIALPILHAISCLASAHCCRFFVLLAHGFGNLLRSCDFTTCLTTSSHQVLTSATQTFPTNAFSHLLSLDFSYLIQEILSYLCTPPRILAPTPPNVYEFPVWQVNVKICRLRLAGPCGDREVEHQPLHNNPPASSNLSRNSPPTTTRSSTSHPTIGSCIGSKCSRCEQVFNS